ncbi:polysaccharide deacetylase family protein [Pseudohongiella sp.]|uniref:NodB homology domain-containing protein n=1 Tax=marine sediment metagenome TaxID=412755 RepID=A0A0F9Z414_9ZZZZ|nr:polysaccharide deacetylase family protein [Pseudohongiella sp.]HDZ08491.1 xylanase [Pseudohongiella sp.]HEA61771.1 xylanase [Pseudohongiella sp.]
MRNQIDRLGRNVKGTARALTTRFTFLGLILTATAVACSGGSAEVQAQHAVIAIYHHVSESTPRSTSLTPDELRTQLEYLRDNDFEVWHLDRVLDALQNQEDMPERVAVLTFDDAYESIYTTGLPMLQEFGYPMTLFVSTQPVDDNQSGYLSWDQIREMADAGVIIANHMVTHPHMIDALPEESEADRLQRMRDELLHAQERIREETGQDHKIMAYPYGEFDNALTEMIEELGFVGLAQNSGAVGYHSDFTALPRFPLAGFYADIDTASTKLQSLAFEIKVQEPRSPITDSRRPAVTLQLAGDFNVSQLGCYAGGEPLQLDWIDREAVHFTIQPAAGRTFDARRFGYICTAPKRGTNRYYWFNKFWARPTPTNAD